MAGPNENEDEELDFSEDEETEETEETEDDSDTEDSEVDADKKAEDKRIRDLQSKADKAEARANKAEAALAAKSKVRGEAGAGADPAQTALLQELREVGLDALFGEYPELKEYSIDRALIEGTTRAELRESGAALVALIKKVSTKAQNKALAEHGITAAPAGTRRTAPVDYQSMSDADFEKLLRSVS